MPDRQLWCGLCLRCSGRRLGRAGPGHEPDRRNGGGSSGLGGQFGESVALSDDGTVMLVGARLEDCAAGNDCGAVYAYSLP
ncbi:MAG: FG-GAP repeat protein [Gammaproteobacteria bacterium]